MTRRRPPAVVVVAYDVTDAARRARVGRALPNPADALQEPAFACRPTARALAGSLRGIVTSWNRAAESLYG